MRRLGSTGMMWLLLTSAAWGQLIQRIDITITNGVNRPALIVKKTVTTNLIEAWSGGSLVFAVPSNGVLPAAYGGTGGRLQGGNLVLTTSSTNVAFSNAYSAAPIVVATPSIPTNCAVTAVTTSNFTVMVEAAGSNYIRWLALPAP